MAAPLAVVCTLAAVAISAAAIRVHETDKVRNATAKMVIVGPTRAALGNATAKLHVATVKVPIATADASSPPRWQTNQEKADAKQGRPPHIPGKVAGALAGAMKSAAAQAKMKKDLAESRQREIEMKRKAERDAARKEFESQGDFESRAGESASAPSEDETADEKTGSASASGTTVQTDPSLDIGAGKAGKTGGAGSNSLFPALALALVAHAYRSL